MRRVSNDDYCDVVFVATDEINASKKWKGVFGYCERSEKISVYKPIPGDKRKDFKPGEITGEDILWVARWLKEKGYKDSLEIALLVIVHVGVWYGGDYWEDLEKKVLKANWPRGWK